MNENRAFGPIAGIVAVIFGLYATMSVLLSDGNTVGELCRYLLAGGFLLGLLQPRLGFFVWLFACGYTDLLKRFLVIGGRMSWADLPYVLGIAPMMFGGVLVSLILAGVTGARPLKLVHWQLLLLGGLFMAASAVMTYADGGGSLTGVMQAVANNGLYAMLVFVVPVLFSDMDDLLRVWRYLIWVFLPVAIYGVAQQVYGFQDFEIAYLRTGMSIEIKQLFMNRVRAFSTLNSPTAFATVCTMMASLCLLLPRRNLGDKPAGRMLGKLGLVLSLTYLAGWMASTGRAAIIIVPFTIYGTWAFQRKGRTVATYAILLVSFVLLVLSSRFVLDRLDAVNQSIAAKMGGSDYGMEMTTVGTYSDRLVGFADVLANPSAWSWFGKGREKDNFLFHDPLSPLLLKTGWVGLAFTLALVAALLIWAHRRLQSVVRPDLKWLACMFAAMGVAVGITSLLSGWILSVFPVNVFFWTAWGGAILLVMQDGVVVPEPEEPAETPAPISAARARRQLVIKSSFNSIQ